MSYQSIEFRGETLEVLKDIRDDLTSIADDIHDLKIRFKDFS